MTDYIIGERETKKRIKEMRVGDMVRSLPTRDKDKRKGKRGKEGKGKREW